MAQIDSSEAARFIAVVGAGVTGLFVAQGLKKHGFSVVVFERDDSLDTQRRDWTIVAPLWNDDFRLETLLPERIVVNLPQALCLPNNNDDEGEKVPYHKPGTDDVDFKRFKGRRVSRQKLRHVLAEGLDIRWGKTVAGYATSTVDETIDLQIAGGESFRAHYIVGADGAQSRVRELLVGHEAAQLRGSGLLRATGIVKPGTSLKTDDAATNNHSATMVLGNNTIAGVGVVSSGNGDSKSSTTFWVKIWKGEPLDLHGPEALQYVLANTYGLGNPWQSVIESSPEDTACDIEEMKYWEPRSFDNLSGRVTLLGDAAHPLPTFPGLDSQEGFYDAWKYILAMREVADSRFTSKPGLAERIMEDFDADMIARGGRAVRHAIEETKHKLAGNAQWRPPSSDAEN